MRVKARVFINTSYSYGHQEFGNVQLRINHCYSSTRLLGKGRKPSFYRYVGALRQLMQERLLL